MSCAATEPARRFALVDCDNFYVSCERVFRPDWRRRPLAVLSNNDGCVIARCHALKRAGIPMGAPYFQVREQLQTLQAVVVSSNYSVYGDLSRRVVEVLEQFTPTLEVYSIDESFLDLSEVAPAALSAYARGIARTVRRWTGIPVGVGIAPTKTLAKLANRIVKRHRVPGGVFDLGGAAQLDELLDAVAVEELWGVGRRWAARLDGINIRTARELRDADPVLIRRRFGVVMQRLLFELRGEACLGLEQVRPKKQIIVSRSFGRSLNSAEELAEAVASYAARAAEKLRAQDSTAGAIQVLLQTRRDRQSRAPEAARTTVTVSFATPTGDSRRLIAAALAGLIRLRVPGRDYVKAGVMLLDLAAVSQCQLELFGGGDRAPERRLMQTIDAVNARFGRGTLFFARQGVERSWAMRRGAKTPAYTSRWSELPQAR